MQYLVIAKEHLSSVGISLLPSTSYAEGGVDAHLLEKVIEKHGRSLFKDKHGVLTGYDPEVDMKIGFRLVLNQDNQAFEKDIFNVHVRHEEGMSLECLLNDSVEDVINLTRTCRSFYMNQMVPRGWITWHDEDKETVFISRNYVAEVENLQRHNDRFTG